MTETMVDASKEHMGTGSRSRETAGRKPGGCIPLLDRLSATRGVWELLDVQPEQVKRLLSSHRPGSFIVARNGDADAKTLFLRLPESDDEAVDLFPLEDNPGSLRMVWEHEGIAKQRADYGNHLHEDKPPSGLNDPQKRRQTTSSVRKEHQSFPSPPSSQSRRSFLDEE